MNQLIWRLHRNQVYFSIAAFVVLAVLLVITGITMANDYHVFLRTCGATQSCADGQGQLFSGDGAIIDIVNLTVAVPLLLGLFWGAPLISKEFEDGTHNLVWTQGVARRHWLRSNVIWVLLAAALWGASIAALASWWRSPENALGSRFDAFDIQGIVPVAYALFAVALGLAVGSLFRRVLPAIATTLGVFVALRVAIGVYVRPHFMRPLTKIYPLAGPRSNPPAGAWSISQGIASPRGHLLKGITPGTIPSTCQPGASGDKSGIVSCLASHGFRQLITFQPGSRFWAFQGLEASIFVIAAAALVGLAFWRVLTKDA
jgi:hypothetical protein